MPSEVFLTILVVLGLLLAASAVTAVVAGVIVAVFRARESRRDPGEHTEQSISVANGLFELGELPEPDAEPESRRTRR